MCPGTVPGPADAGARKCASGVFPGGPLSPHRSVAHKRFPPIHSPDRAEDPKTPQVDGGDRAGGSPEDEEEVEDCPVASESSLDEAYNEGLQ